MKKTITFLLVLPVFLLFSACGKKEAPMQAALEVPVTSVVQQDVRLESEYTGKLTVNQISRSIHELMEQSLALILRKVTW